MQAAALGSLTIGMSKLVSKTRDAVNSNVDFARGLGDIETLIPGQSKLMETYSSAIREIGIEQGRSLSDLTGGVYNVISAFGDSNETISRTIAISKSAVAGNSSVTDSLRLVSAVTKAYGDTSADAIAFTGDLAFQSVKLG